jgi:pentatricopeptide repeat protein
LKKKNEPDLVTCWSVGLSYFHLKALNMDAMIHGYIIQRRFEFHVYVATGIINMYAECQSVKIAHRAFDKMPNNAVSWNAMVTGYAENGHANEALALFHQMQRVGMKPDSITMLRVLPEMCPFGSSAKW